MKKRSNNLEFHLPELTNAIDSNPILFLCISLHRQMSVNVCSVWMCTYWHQMYMLQVRVTKEKGRKEMFFLPYRWSFSRLHLAPGDKSPNVSGLLIATPVFSDPYPSGPFFSPCQGSTRGQEVRTSPPVSLLSLYIEAVTPSGLALGDGAFGRQLSLMRSWGWGPHDGIRVLIRRRETRTLSLSPRHVRTELEEQISRNQEVDPRQEPNLLPPWFWVPSLQACEK